MSGPNPPQAQPDRPDWQQRFSAARVRLPRWARDEPSRACYANNATGTWQLASWDLDSDAHTALTSKPTGVIDGALLSDGSAVAWFDDHGGDEVGGWVRTPFSGGQATPLMPGVPDGWASGLALRGERVVAGVSTRDTFRVWASEGGEARVLATHEHPVVVASLSADASLVALAHTEHGDVLHPSGRVIDARDGRVVADLAGGDGTTTSPGAWSPVPGDQRLLVATDRTGRTRTEIWEPLTGQRSEPAVDLPGDVSADWWPDGQALLLVHDHEGRSELYRHTLHDGATEPLGLGPGTVDSARVRPDGSLWYAFGSGATPSEVRARDGGGDRLLLAPPGPRAPRGTPYESIHYASPEAESVHAFLARPPGAGPHPLVVDVHGGPASHTTDRMDPWVQAWLDHGFAVLMPNYRGSTGYGKGWEDTLQGDPGRPELVDVRAGALHLVDKGIADPQRLVIVGASWGGYLALQGVGTQPDVWAAAVATIPVADYPTAYEDESPDLQAYDRALFGGSPEQRQELFAERSPLTHVGNVRAPVLVITGANDTRCPRRQVDNYIEALAAHGVPHHYDVFDAGHGSLSVEEMIRQQALALDFVAEHLGTSPAKR